MAFVDDSFRDFELDIELTVTRQLPGVPGKAWELIKGQITLQAQRMIKKQWDIMLKGKDKDCEG